MKRLCVLLAFLAPQTMASELKPLQDANLSTILGFLDELETTPRDSDQLYFVRAFAAPVELGECGGRISSCPDVRLYISASTGDLGDVPKLFVLPPAKGWEFVDWEKAKGDAVGLILRTAIPSNNIDPAERKLWHPLVYHIWIGSQEAGFEVR